MLKVVIVEDEELIRTGLEYMIDWIKMDCTLSGVAKDGAEGLTMICEKHPDVVITDIRMPVMDGLAATRCIRESDHSDSKTVPIVAMTANVFEEDVKKSFDAGMNAHLSKPVDIKQMYAVLDELVTGDGLL